MVSRHRRNQRGRQDFRRRTRVSEPIVTSLLEFAASLPVPVRHEPYDEIDWSRPRNSWDINQEQTYFNMFGHIPSDDFTIDQLLTGSSSNQQAEGSTNRDLFPDYLPESATSPIQSIAGSSRLQGEELFMHGKTRKCSEEDKGRDEICVVCQSRLHEQEMISTLNCGHEYHLQCIELWLRKRNACPLCNATVIAS